jgi:hypothetical protein
MGGLQRLSMFARAALRSGRREPAVPAAPGRVAHRYRSLLVESLEDRRLLTVLAPLALSAAKATYLHLDPSLVNLVRPVAGLPQASVMAQSSGTATGQMEFDSAGRVGVEITATNVAKLVPSLAALGFQTTDALPADHLVDGYLPVSELTAANGLSSQGLLGVVPLYRPIVAAAGNVGSYVDEGDAVVQADRVRAALPGIDGAGVTVGVLSDSFNALGGAGADIYNGDLPAAGVKVLQDYTGPDATDEGRAMLQVIHHLAPGASLAFATAYDTQASFAQNILDLANPAQGDCKIIVDDVGYFDEPFFQDGIVAQAVDQVASQGVAYFSAAGNDSDQAYDSADNPYESGVSFMTDTIPGISSSPALYYQYAPGVDRQQITVPAGYPVTLSMQWDQPFYTTNGVTTELDMYLVNAATGAVVASAADNTVASQIPNQILFYQNPSYSAQQYDIVICDKQGPSPGRIKYINFGDGLNISFDTYATNSGTIIGHAAAAGAMAVAAAPFFDQLQPEPYSSVGEVDILFGPTGNRLASPEVRNKPDMMAPDGTTTTVTSVGFQIFNDPAYHFFGTSCAAPHAAAVAALVWQADAGDSAAAIENQMKATADPLGTNGTPNNPQIVGAGLINAYQAILGQPVPATSNVNDDFQTGYLGQDWQVYDAGAGRTTVTTADNPEAGTTYQLMLDTPLQPPAGMADQAVTDPTSASYGLPWDGFLSEATLNVNAVGSTNVVLSFDEKQSGIPGIATPCYTMPSSFTGHGEYDGVALSVDGVHWYNLVWMAPNANYQSYSINLTAFARNNGLGPLGADTQIKFQHYGCVAYQSPTYAMAFDNVQVTGLVPPPPVPPPAVTAIGPAAGRLAGGTQVTIAGTSLAGATAVYFGTVPGTIVSDTATQIVATSPKEAAGAVNVCVITAQGTSAACPADQFTYAAAPTIGGVTPATGLVSGGATVTITGKNLAGATSVLFGSTAASIVEVSATQITVISPAGNAGTVNIRVLTPGGESAINAHDKFSYTKKAGGTKSAAAQAALVSAGVNASPVAAALLDLLASPGGTDKTSAAITAEDDQSLAVAVTTDSGTEPADQRKSDDPS